MRFVIDIIHFKKPGFYDVPPVGPVALDRAGYYALTQAELVGPFADRQEARRIAAVVARQVLRPDHDKPLPFVMPTRIVEI